MLLAAVFSAHTPSHVYVQYGTPQPGVPLPQLTCITFGIQVVSYWPGENSGV